MKIYVLLIAVLFSANLVFAQNDMNEEVDYFQSMYGMEKKLIVKQFLEIDDEQNDAFWATYNEYEEKRKELGKKRIELLKYLEENNETLTDDKSEWWLKELLKLRSDTEKLLSSYYKKVKRVSTPKIAAQFYQIESYLLTAQRFIIQDSLPVVGGQLD